MSTFRNFRKTNVTLQYLEKAIKVVKYFSNLTFRPQSSECLVRVKIAVKKERVRVRRGAFLFVETIPFIANI